MAISATWAVTMGWLVGSSPVLLLVVGIIWGISVVADSAQFSPSVAELSDAEDVGSMLTLQTSARFLLTLVAIQITGPLAAAAGILAAFSLLAAGPVSACVAMRRLRAHPDAPTSPAGSGRAA